MLFVEAWWYRRVLKRFQGKSVEGAQNFTRPARRRIEDWKVLGMYKKECTALRECVVSEEETKQPSKGLI